MFIFEYLLCMYEYLFLWYYHIIPMGYDVINTIIQGIEYRMKCIGLKSFHLPQWDCPGLRDITKKEVLDLLHQKDNEIYNLFRIHCCVFMVTFFSVMIMNDYGSSFLIHGITWIYPLYHTIENISDVETKNLWLAYWVFFIWYEKLFVLDIGWGFYKQIEIILFYVIVRYKYPKKMLLDILHKVHLDNSNSLVDNIRNYIHDMYVHMKLVVQKLMVIQ
jgi:hypothetical protein